MGGSDSAYIPGERVIVLGPGLSDDQRAKTLCHELGQFEENRPRRPELGQRYLRHARCETQVPGEDGHAADAVGVGADQALAPQAARTASAHRTFSVAAPPARPPPRPQWASRADLPMCRRHGSQGTLPRLSGEQAGPSGAHCGRIVRPRPAYSAAVPAVPGSFRLWPCRPPPLPQTRGERGRCGPRGSGSVPLGPCRPCRGIFLVTSTSKALITF